MQESAEVFDKKDMKALAKHPLLRNINLEHLASQGNIKIKVEKETKKKVISKIMLP